MTPKTRNNQYIFFDLDGTLADPTEGISRSVIHALTQMNRPIPDETTLRKFFGPPLRKSFRELAAMTADEAETAVAHYRAYFAKNGIYENIMYPGVGDLLRELSDTGRTLILATFKPTVYAKGILESFGVLKYFSHLSDVKLADDFNSKTGIIKDLLYRAGVQELNGCVMVGDRSYDMEAAKEAGIRAIGVLYGFGSREELVAAGADAVVDTVSQLRALF